MQVFDLSANQISPDSNKNLKVFRFQTIQNLEHENRLFVGKMQRVDLEKSNYKVTKHKKT